MEHAIVIGGGIAGMCAAKVLAEHCKVTLIERDTYPNEISDRRGVPQSKMFHTLLERGRRDMESIFPGLHKTLEQGHIPRATFGFNTALMSPFGWGRNFLTHIPRALFCTRGYLESTMRRLFLEDGRIDLIENATVTSLLSDEPETCTGVSYKVQGNDETKQLSADLVIDASGASSRAGTWLKALNLEPPAEHELDPLLTYGGVILKMKPDVEFPKHWWWTHGAFIQRMPPHDNKGAHLIRQEGDLWLLTLVAGDGFDIPKTMDDVVEFLARMRSPLVHDMLPYFEPVGELTSYRLPKNKWKYYEEWSEKLDGFIAIGASTCVFNPNQGQGMSVAAGDAVILRNCLETTTSPKTLPTLFFKEQARFQRNAYKLACCNDLKFATVQGKRTLGTRLFNWYRDFITAAGSVDPWVAREAAGVDMLLDPVSKLYRPWFVLRTFFAGIFLGWRQNPTRAERAAPYPPKPVELQSSKWTYVKDTPGIIYRFAKHHLRMT